MVHPKQQFASGVHQLVQGSNTGAGGPFDAYNGAANAYIGANYNSTGTLGTISNWLSMPNRTLRNGDTLSFYTRKPTVGSGMTDYPDRLEVRLSTNGASTNVGGTATGVGDFSTLLLSINPSLIANVYPQVWTQYTVTLSGLPAPTSGRMAFRYFVTNGGQTGAASDYIGIDNVVYTQYVCPTLTITNTTLANGAFGQPYSAALTQTGALGAPTYAVVAGALPPGMTLSAGGTLSGTPTALGTFNFTITVSDASGCTGSQAYSVQVNPGVPTAPQSVTAAASMGQATVSWTAPASDGGDPITDYSVQAVEDSSKTCATTGVLSCVVPGLTYGSSYTFSVVAINGVGASAAGLSNTVVPVQTALTGSVPGMAGTATAAIIGGDVGCTFEPGSGFTTLASAPAGHSLPFGGFAFSALGCTGGVTIELTYPQALPANVEFWKFGPATLGATSSTWFAWTGATLSADRRTLTYTVIDNGVGDANPASGSIQDPIAPALINDPVNVPVDNPWALAALAIVLAGMGVHQRARSQQR